MKTKILGLILMAIGGAGLGGSYYITEQVLQGQAKIDQAKKTVKKADSLFSMSPYTDPLGKAITGSANKKIQMGQDEVNRYTEIASLLKLVGYIGLALGGLIFLRSIFRKKN